MKCWRSCSADSCSIGNFSSLRALSDGNLAVVCKIGYTDLLLAKTSSSGWALWKQVIFFPNSGDSGILIPGKLGETDDAGMIITGRRNMPSGGRAAFLIKTDSLGRARAK